MFHPSYLLRNPSKEKGSPKDLTWQDIKKVRKVKEVLEKRYAPHTCPFCGHKGRVTRISTGIWMCKSVE